MKNNLHSKSCRLRELTKKDEEKAKLAAVQNELESFSYDVKNKLYDEEFEECSTEEERETIREKLNEIMEWYEEQPLNTPYQVLYIMYVMSRELINTDLAY